MPVRPRRGARQRAKLESFGQMEIAVLIQTGRGLLRRELDDNPDLLADAWEHYGQEFLPEFIAEWPGCRPHAWWKCGAPESWDAIQQQFAEFDKQLNYPLADRESVAWRRFQLWYLRQNSLMDEAEAAAAAKREKTDLDFLKRHFSDVLT